MLSSRRWRGSTILRRRSCCTGCSNAGRAASSGELAPQAASAYLSGLLIASDIGGALRLLAPAGDARRVHLIGDRSLTQLYARGLAAQHCTATEVAGTSAALAGLAQVHRQLKERAVMNAVH